MGLLWIERKYEEEGRDEQMREETIERYVLEMSDVKDGKKQIREALPKLAPYEPHPTEKDLYVASFWPVRQQPGANVWDLEITYSSEVNLPQNPLLEPMEWTVDTDVEEEPSFRDVDGRPYLTTAGSLIEATNDVPHVVLAGSKKIATNWPDWLLTYGGAVNIDDVRIKGKTWPAGTLKCTKIKIGKDEVSESGVAFCALDLELSHHRNGWQLETPNRDFYQLIPRPADPGQKKPTPAKKQKYDRVKIYVKNEHGVKEEPTEPQMIDQQGKLIEIPTTENIVILKFNRNRRLPFSELPLK
ncbi:MAG: hypothetical protein HY290_33520 [Planctomycetia bacterium]|nr:hypothetical protein [Planctomycetia bacterium]